jgi:uncharacterized protein (DUF2235 family)
MGKNIVVCCDGTGNEVEGNLSNVLKLFRITQRNAEQRVHYSPGIGTIGSSDAWTRIKQNTKSVFELATGYGLDDELLGAYRFVCEQFEVGPAPYRTITGKPLVPSVSVSRGH